ncbi:PIG-L deacetylase family protein [Nocardia sp. CDC160]|uniref:PIG-L deacetylase family protein n=1 Tax=Nocardia sp. CDC160 TaxID=3112166 RepID=UPI002DC0474C|nr:PIG-L family deacetylase [Nocardia sp. CDC160]MEC3914674.1 PIG-L family deacetylase [Nocardia sp. CDC160]
MELSRVLDGVGRVVVVSPHFDDAVLSVGGLIAGRVGRGQVVEVLTVFSGAGVAVGGGGRQKAFSDYGVRGEEDERALGILGARGRRLGLFERLFREPRPRGPLALFRTSEDLARGAYVETVRRGIGRLVEDGDTVVLAPLGIGNHVDHVIVAVAALRVGSRVLFYEDFNALSERNRRRHPVSRLRPFPYRSAPGWASPRAGFELEAMSLLARGPDAAALAGVTVRPEQWSMTAFPVAGGLEAVKLRAIGEYRTQTRALGGEKRLREIMRRAHAVRGGEPIWRFDATGAGPS